jgi:hypothetical protein
MRQGLSRFRKVSHDIFSQRSNPQYQTVISIHIETTKLHGMRIAESTDLLGERGGLSNTYAERSGIDGAISN